MAIARDNVKNIYPLAPMQEGLLFHALADPESIAYFQQLALRIEGDLDIALFRACWNELVARHDALRTVFAPVEAGRPLQVVLKRREIDFTYHDLRGSDATATAARLRAEERMRRFDLTSDMLLRIMVLAVADRVHEVIFSNHHIILDGWSLGILQSEFLEIYEARQRGTAPRLNAAPAYNQFINFLAGRDHDAAREFWRASLADYDQAIGLPAISNRKLGPARYETASFVLDAALMDGIERRAAALGATTGTAMQAIFAVLLARYNGVEDVVFGSSVSGRPVELPDVERIVGLFINTIPVRAQPRRDKSMATLVTEMQAAALAAEPHHFYPLARIQSDSALQQGLIGALIAYENYPIDARVKRLGTPDGLRFTMLEAYDRTHYEFVVQCLPGDSLTLRLTYDPGRYAPEQVQAIEAHVSAIARALVAHPDGPIGALDLVTGPERAGLVLPARREHAPGGTLVDGFAAAVRAFPDAVAVTVPATEERAAESVSYAALAARAAHLAQRLRRLGVGPESRVGLCAERSAELVVGVLGILQAGGAYVPLDPSYPVERLGYMVADAGVAVVVATAGVIDLAAGLSSTVVPVLAAGTPDEEPLAVRIAPENAAYVIYTSGSTGTPKGVVVSHHNVMRLFAASAAHYDFGAADVWTLFHSFAFDFSVWEIFGALLQGGRLVIVPYWASRTPAVFLRLLADEGVTVLNQTPSAFGQLLQAEGETGGVALPRLRWVIFGGEALDPGSLAPWFARHGDRTRLVNMYGITETTVHVTWREIDGSALAAESVIGAPLDDLSLYVLDERMRPVPVGVAGELYVGGAGLARGYLGRPALTAERFVPDPFARRAGARLYRSGDLARRLPGGEIAYLGRIDQQVKIRGFRIEPEEIAARLRQHDAVRAAAVIAQAEPGGGRRLVAYVAGEHVPDGETLRRFLAASLPDYMLPAAFVALAALPLTANGKLDRRALPAPETAAPATPFHAPATQTEQALAAIWQEVLGRQTIGRDDSYFALGGDSIKAIQISARLLKLGLKLQIRDLFRHPTIAALAPRLQQATTPHDGGEDTGDIPLTPIQARFFAEHGPVLHRFNHAVLLGAPDGLDPAALGRALQALQHRHDVLRYRFIRRDGRLVQETGAPPLELERIDLRGRADWATRLTQHADAAQGGFALETGPLLRAILFLTDRGDRLLLVIHHLIVDGVSWRILLEDLAATYRAAAAGAVPQYPPASASFARWSRALADFAASPILTRELPYWHALAEATDEAPPTRTSRAGNARSLAVELAAAETESLLTDANRAYNTTVEELLLTALGRALQAWHGGNRSLIAREGHGREALFADIDVNRTLGWFTSLYPFALVVPIARDLGEQIKTVKEAARRVPGHGIGYGVLRYLRPEDATTAPLHRLNPWLSFNYLGDFDAALTAGGLSAIDHPIGAPVDPDTHRPFALDLALLVRNGRLQLAASYDLQLFPDASIRALLDAFSAEIRIVTAFCRARGGVERTPADFTAADIDLAQLATITGLIEDDNLEDLYPLSPMQLAMLVHTAQQPESRAYFEQFSYRLHGEFDLPAFRAAWHELFRRHDILRTAFLAQLEHKLQAVLRVREPEITVTDLSGIDPAAQERRIDERRIADRQRGFDFIAAPLMRFHVLRLAPTRHEIIWSMHHILLDGWSTARLQDEFLLLYDAFRLGRAARLDPAIPYARYIEWLRARDTQAGLAYWRNYLDGSTKPTALPRERVAGTYELATHRSTLDRDLSARLDAVAAACQVTPSSVFLAGWGAFLSRLLDLDDVVFGTVVSGRPAALGEAERMIGLFINTVPVRIRLDPRRKVSELLRHLHDDIIAGEAHHYCSLADIQAQSPLQQALIDHLVVFENYPVAAMLARSDGPLRVERVERHEQTNYDFTIVITPGAAVGIEVLYNKSVFTPEMVARLIAHFTRVLESLAAAPDGLVGSVDLMSADERALVVRAFGGRSGRAVSVTSLWSAFLRQVERRGTAAALRCGEVSVGYSDLAGRACGVAGALRDRGIGVDDAVGIMAERSVGLIAGLIGIAAAGGGYVGLDAGDPPARLRQMAAASGLKAVVAEARHAGVAAMLDVPVVILEEAAPDADWRDVAVRGGGESLAYVSFTSGSTGTAKGVAVSQRSVLSLVLGSDYARLDESETVLHYAPVGFDASTFEIWGALLTGGCLVVMPPGVASLAELGETIRREEVTTLWLTAGLFELMVAERLSDLRGVRQLLAGGDVLPVGAVRRVLAALPECRLINGYGPTETTTFACCHAVSAAEAALGPIPIGRPIAGAVVYILDRQMRPCAIGVSGEIYIGGNGVARGYAGEAAMTAAAFVPDPFSVRGERLYRSGDLGRWRPDGVVEFLGRADDQVKLRGYRLSLGAIETALGDHAGVERCVVVARGEGAGKRLIAYVVAPGVSVTELRAHLAERLPRHAVPSQIVTLAALPITANGKIDRAALPAPPQSGAMAAQSESERRIAAIWQEVLGIDQLGRDDNFFDLGGHSLSATQITARLQTSFNIALPLRAIFEAPTVADLAEEVAKAPPAGSDGAKIARQARSPRRGAAIEP